TLIPQMGYMALLRNLRNFVQAQVAPAVLQQVAARLADPNEVAASKQFPYHFYAAYKALSGTSAVFNTALETAATLAVANIPIVKGRNLVLVDVSGSMSRPVSQRSAVDCKEIGALFGGAMALSSPNVDLVAF